MSPSSCLSQCQSGICGNADFARRLHGNCHFVGQYLRTGGNARYAARNAGEGHLCRQPSRVCRRHGIRRGVRSFAGCGRAVSGRPAGQHWLSGTRAGADHRLKASSQSLCTSSNTPLPPAITGVPCSSTASGCGATRPPASSTKSMPARQSQAFMCSST